MVGMAVLLFGRPVGDMSENLRDLRGARLSLIADVNVPVRALFDAQKAGVQDAVDAAACKWTGTQHPSTEFKSPPPGFERGAKA